MTTTTTEYYAVPDPDDPDRMTYWRRNRRGSVQPWPPRTTSGPALFKSDVPADLHGQDRATWIRQWYRRHAYPWRDLIDREILMDPDACRARFASFTSRCCMCGRKLTDPASKTYGIGPECRDGLPDDLLARMAEQVGRAHAGATMPANS